MSAIRDRIAKSFSICRVCLKQLTLKEYYLYDGYCTTC